MDLTRQTWRTAALAVSLAGLAPLTGSVVPVVGTAAVSGWLVAVQLAAVRSVRSTAADATVQVEFDSTRKPIGTPIGVTVTVERPTQAAGTALTVTYPTPTVAEPIREADRRVELAPSETRGSTTFSIRSSVPGRIRLPEPTWRLVDASGSVTESDTWGPTPAVDVIEAAGSPRQAGGGKTEIETWADPSDQQLGRAEGVDRLRPYEATDPAARIDWNTTARLGEPYVRETAGQRGQPTSLIVDHRAKLLAEATDEPMFESVRSVALGVVATAAERGDPLGLVVVDDDGATNAVEPTTRPAGYSEIRRRLQELDLTPTDQSAAGIEINHPEPAGRGVRSDDHAVGRLLETFESASTTDPPADRRPLVEAVQHHRTTTPGSTVIITDDTDRAELWAAVRAALQTATDVVVYLTPRVRFDADHTAPPARVSDRYQQFERFRRRLDGVASVTAREVSPAVDGQLEQLTDFGGPIRPPWSISRPPPQATNGQGSRQTNGQMSQQTNGRNTATAAVSNGGSNE